MTPDQTAALRRLRAVRRDRARADLARAERARTAAVQRARAAATVADLRRDEHGNAMEQVHGALMTGPQASIDFDRGRDRIDAARARIDAARDAQRAAETRAAEAEDAHRAARARAVAADAAHDAWDELHASATRRAARIAEARREAFDDAPAPCPMPRRVP